MARSKSSKRGKVARRLPPEAPTPERLAHDPHDVGPSPLGAKRVWRAIDTIDFMARRGSLGPAQVSAARRFQEDFRQAGLDPLRAQNLERMDRGIGSDERRLDARRRIGRAMDKLGGHGSLLAQVCWYVLGAGFALADVATRLEWSGGSVDRKALAGVLIAALDLLTR